MELSKRAPGTATASRPSLSASPQQAHPANHSSVARVPFSEYLIVPMSGQSGASSHSAAALSELMPMSRVSLRPPQQVMIVQKEQLPKPHPQPFHSVRAKFRESLAAALGLGSDHLSGQQSGSNVSYFGPAVENIRAGDIVLGAPECASKLNSQKDLTSDIDAGVIVSLKEPESKRLKISDEVTGEKKGAIQNVQILPFRIEQELFKLFGAVNKKYKEKGRSLLFNLKDKSNPALREQVLSGDITPKFLCSMTTEELASKELSAWRLAKAEELAKMVVLPDREVDIRTLVRKTHKGEFHVEVEESDGILVGVELGGDLLSDISKPIESQTESENRTNLHRGDKESDTSLEDEVGGKGNSNLQSNLEECLANEMADPMLECMLENLDRCTEALHSKLHHEDHSTETAEDAFPNNADITLEQGKVCITEDMAALTEFELKCNAECPQDKYRSRIKSSENAPDPGLCQANDKGDRLIKVSSETMASEKLDTSNGSVSIPGDTVQPNASPGAALTHLILWEGTIQLNQTSFTKVFAIFKSGEKPSTNDWRCFVEIKGRVKLTDFQEYLEQLPNSRRRAVLVTELRWKEDSLESSRQHLLQTIDSYIADERVGLVKLAEGVELYLCPSHGKASPILAKHLPEEHLGSLTVTGEASAIGVVVWRRSHDSTRIPTRHDGSNCPPMSISRKHRAVIASSVPMPSELRKPPGSCFTHSNEHLRLNDDGDASNSVLPGFGQFGVKHANSLPEYDFVSVSNNSVNVVTSHTSRSQQHVPMISPPLDQVRKLVHKYGNRHVSAQSSYGDDDHLQKPDQVRQLVHMYGNKYVSTRPSDGDDDHLGTPDQVSQLVYKYGNRYVPDQPSDGDNDHLQTAEQVRQLVLKYDNRDVPSQTWDGNDAQSWPPGELRQLVQKYGNDADYWPPDQVKQLVRRYGDRYSEQPWDCRDDLPELYSDPIQSGHQQAWHHEQTDRYYHHPHHQLEEQYEMQHAMATRHLTSRMPQVYFGPEQHMAVQRQWHYQSVMHRADETFGWRSSTQLRFAGMPGETGMAMPYFDVEPDMVMPRPTSLLGGREPWLGAWDWEAQHYVRERF